MISTRRIRSQQGFPALYQFPPSKYHWPDEPQLRESNRYRLGTYPNSPEQITVKSQHSGRRDVYAAIDRVKTVPSPKTQRGIETEETTPLSTSPTTNYKSSSKIPTHFLAISPTNAPSRGVPDLTTRSYARSQSSTPKHARLCSPIYRSHHAGVPEPLNLSDGTGEACQYNIKPLLFGC